LVNGGKLVVIERKELDLIRQEKHLQLSGEVSDESAQAIGRELGAQVIITGSLRNVGKSYRFKIKTLNVETAVIAAEYSAEIDPKEETVQYLLNGSIPPNEDSVPDKDISKDTWPEYLLEEIVDDRSITVSFVGNDTITSVRIPASFNGLPVTVIKENAFKDRKNLSRVDIPSSVTTIGDSAFYGCSSLARINIPSSVTAIGDSTFYECSSLARINIPSSVTTIGKQAFYRCWRLVSIDIPSSVTTIGSQAFSRCSSLERISVDPQNNVYRSINEVLFTRNAQILVCYPAGKKGPYSIPPSVTTIGDYAFNGCSSLERIDIPSSVTDIGFYAFSGCSSLESVHIPSSVTKISNFAFVNCKNLASINVALQNNTYMSGDGVLFIKNGQTLICFPEGKKGEYIIPSSVTTIEYYAFSGCSGLESVSIPSSVTTIKKSTFSMCSSLENVTIPPSVTTIEDSAFANCSSLKSVNFQSPSSVTSIGKQAFYGCWRIDSIDIPPSVTSIGSGAFSGRYVMFGESRLLNVSLSRHTIVASDAFENAKMNYIH